MNGEEHWPDLPWQAEAAENAALAQGQTMSQEVRLNLHQARRIETHFDFGTVVAHRWSNDQSPHLPPVVLFHGGSGSWTHWVKNIAALVDAGHTVWALDLPGFGASDAPPQVVDADGMLPWIAAWLEQNFPLQAVRLVGFSFGGMTAVMLAACYPHLVAQLCVVGAPGMGLKARPRVQLKGWRHLQDPELQLQHHIYNLQALMVRNADLIDKDMVSLHVANVRRDRLPRRRISSTDVVLRHLPQVQCPVMAIYGEFDALYPAMLDEVEALMASHSSNWHGLHRVPKAGHWVQYEQAPAFHAVLLPWLQKSLGT